MAEQPRDPWGKLSKHSAHLQSMVGWESIQTHHHRYPAVIKDGNVTSSICVYIMYTPLIYIIHTHIHTHVYVYTHPCIDDSPIKDSDLLASHVFCQRFFFSTVRPGHQVNVGCGAFADGGRKPSPICCHGRLDHHLGTENDPNVNQSVNPWLKWLRHLEHNRDITVT